MSAEAARHPESLLVVRLGAMGDVIHTMPAVAALRQALPNIKMGWVIEERWSELLCTKDAPRSGPRSPARPLVDFVHCVDTKTWRKSLPAQSTRQQISAAVREIRRQHYEVVVDFQGAIKSAIVARIAGGKTIFGMDQAREAPARLFYQHRVATRGSHVVDQYHSLAEAVTRMPLPKMQPEFPCDESAERKIADQIKEWGPNLILINPGAGWSGKQWPTERYGEVARALREMDHTVLINAAPSEQELANAVRESSDNTATPISCSIAELIALTRRARLFLGGDTGPLHLAAALQIPVVAIFGPTDPARNGPYGTNSIVLRNPASRTSLSHTSAPDAGLLQITADEVISAARSLLQETNA